VVLLVFPVLGHDLIYRLASHPRQSFSSQPARVVSTGDIGRCILWSSYCRNAHVAKSFGLHDLRLPLIDLRYRRSLAIQVAAEIIQLARHCFCICFCIARHWSISLHLSDNWPVAGCIDWIPLRARRLRDAPWRRCGGLFLCAGGKLAGMDGTPVKRRRWLPQFSLRTFFIVVTVLAIWLGYAIPRIQQRHRFLSQPDLICEFNDTPPTTLNKNHTRFPVFAPWELMLLGERGVVSVWLPRKIWSPENEAAAVRLFPEAMLLKINESGDWEVVRH
jgi:hypothetical protein